MGIFDWIFKRVKKSNFSDSLIYDATNSSVELNSFYANKLECGLTPGEIILLDWTGKTGRNYSFPGYFKYNFGIDAKSVQEKLFSDGFLFSEKTLQPLKVSELKEILKDNGLPVTGKKAELIDRIGKNLNLDSLNIPLSLRLSNKGSEIVLSNDGYIKAYYDKYFDMENYHIFKNRLPFKGSYNDIKWAFLNDNVIKYTAEGKFGLLRNERFAQYQQLVDENKIANAFSYILEVFILDVSGLGNGYYYSEPPRPDYTDVMVVPRILDMIQSDVKTLTTEDFDVSFDVAVRRFSSLMKKSFLSEKDLEFIRNNISTATKEEFDEYLKKFSKYK